MRLAACAALAACVTLAAAGGAAADDAAGAGAPGTAVSSPAPAVSSAELELLKRIELLTKRVEELEKRLTERAPAPGPGAGGSPSVQLQPPAAPPRMPERTEEEAEEGDEPAGPPAEVKTVRGGRLQFSGWAQFRITNIANFQGDAEVTDMDFQATRFRPTLIYQLSPQWQAKLDVEGTTRVNAQTSPLGNVSLRDAYGQWENHGLQARLGQWAVPFGFENGIESTGDRIEMERARVVTTFFPARRDIGLYLRTVSKNPNATWGVVSVYNGNGINRSDNNNRKNVTGMVRVPFGHHTLGFSGLSGDFKNGAVTTARNALGMDHEYINHRFFTKSELIGGRDAGAKVWGGYVAARYNTGKYGGPFGRYDVYDPNLNAPNDMWRRMAMGWWDDITPLVRLTGEYDVITNQLTGTKGTDTYAFQVATKF